MDMLGSVTIILTSIAAIAFKGKVSAAAAGYLIYCKISVELLMILCRISTPINILIDIEFFRPCSGKCIPDSNIHSIRNSFEERIQSKI